MGFFDNCLSLKRKQAISTFVVSPIVSVGLVGLGLLLRYLVDTDLTFIAYIGVVVFVLNFISMINEFMFRLKKRNIDKILSAKEYEKLLKKIGRHPAPWIVNKAFSQVDDATILKQLVVIIQSDRDQERQVNAALALGFAGVNAQPLVNDLHQVLRSKEKDYVKSYTALSLLLIEGIKSNAFTYFYDLYQKGELEISFMSEDLITLLFDVLKREHDAQQSPTVVTQSLTQPDTDTAIGEILAHTRLQSQKDKGRIWNLFKIRDTLIEIVLGYGVIRFIEWAITRIILNCQS